MNDFRILYQFFTGRDRRRLILLAVVMLLGALFEVFGIGLVLPLLSLIQNPAELMRNATLGPWIAGLGIASEQTLVVVLTLLFLVIFSVKSLFITWEWWVVYHFVFACTIRLGKRLLKAYLNADYSFHLTTNSADLIRNVRVETMNVMVGVLLSLLFVCSEAILTFGLVLLILLANPTVALIALFTLGLVAALYIVAVHRKSEAVGKRRAEKEAGLLQWLSQSLDGIREIKVLGCEDYFLRKFEDVGGDFADAQFKYSIIGFLPRVLIEQSLAIGLGFMIIVLLLMGEDFGSSVPTLTLFGAAAMRLIPAFTRIASSVNNIRFYSASVGLVGRDLHEFERPLSTEPRPGGVIRFDQVLEFSHVSYRYPNSSEWAVEDLTFQIRVGTKVAFVGQTGAGKTTIANLLLGLFDPDQGQILVDGVDIHCNLPAWKRLVGYIPQDCYLLDDTLRRNVAFGLSDDRIDGLAVEQAIERAQLSSFVESLPQGLDTMVGERGVRLSGGQRQRIGIARGLYWDPPLVILDEATSSLDYKTERDLQRAIESLGETKTLIVIAHRLSTIQMSDEIFLLAGGRISGRGTFSELRASQPLFSRLVEAGQLR